MKSVSQTLVESVTKATTPKPSKHTHIHIPPVLTDDTVDPQSVFPGRDITTVTQNLEHAYRTGATDTEACAHADITLYELSQYEIMCPSAKQYKSLLRAVPVFAARQTLLQGLQTDPKLAFTYLKAIDALPMAPQTNTKDLNLLKTKIEKLMT